MGNKVYVLIWTDGYFSETHAVCSSKENVDKFIKDHSIDMDRNYMFKEFELDTW